MKARGNGGARRQVDDDDGHVAVGELLTIPQLTIGVAAPADDCAVELVQARKLLEGVGDLCVPHRLLG